MKHRENILVIKCNKDHRSKLSYSSFCNHSPLFLVLARVEDTRCVALRKQNNTASIISSLQIYLVSCKGEIMYACVGNKLQKTYECFTSFDSFIFSYEPTTILCEDTLVTLYAHSITCREQYLVSSVNQLVLRVNVVQIKLISMNKEVMKIL